MDQKSKVISGLIIMAVFFLFLDKLQKMVTPQNDTSIIKQIDSSSMLNPKTSMIDTILVDTIINK